MFLAKTEHSTLSPFKMKKATLLLLLVPMTTFLSAKSAEDANLLIVARAVVASALARRESRGGHFRTDFPDTDPAQAHHSGVTARA